MIGEIQTRAIPPGTGKGGALGPDTLKARLTVCMLWGGLTSTFRCQLPCRENEHGEHPNFL